MDRETFERRRKLGYTDDPRSIVDPLPAQEGGRPALRILTGCFVLSLVCAICVSGTLRTWAIAAAVGSILCFVAVLIFRMCIYIGWFYKAHREPTNRFLTEVGIGLAVGYVEKRLRERRKRGR